MDGLPELRMGRMVGDQQGTDQGKSIQNYAGFLCFIDGEVRMRRKQYFTG
jgi:hypothetical protein